MDEVRKKIIDLQEAFVYWKEMVRSLDGQSGIVILASQDDQINKYTIECVPALLEEKRYYSVIFMSDREDVLQLANHSSSNYKMETMLCTRKQIIDFCYLQTLTNCCSDVYINISEYIDDADSFLFEGFCNLSKKDIVARVFLQLNTLPMDAIERKENKQHELISEINWQKEDKWIPRDRYNYDTQQGFLEEKLNCLKKDTKISVENKIVLYGDTQTARMCIPLLEGYKDVVICDKNENKRGCERNGVKVDTPDSLLIPYNPNVRILITIYQFKELCERLLFLGYRLGEQVFIVNYKMIRVEQPKELFLKKLEDRVLKGEDAYHRLRSQYPTQKILLSPWAASGDIYMDGLYLKDYVVKNNIEDYIVTVSTVGAKKVAELFDIETVLISEEDSFAILDFARAMGFENINVHNINITVGEGQRTIYLHGVVDFNTFHQRLAFQENVRQTIPKIKQQNADEWFQKYNLKKGKTILLSPYSNTLGNIPEEICIELVKRLKNRGYDICTNVFGNEVPIPGTEGICIPYSQVLDFVEKAGGFIGMRSGLCDVISSTTSKVAILYQTYSCNKRSVYEYFSLQRMGLKEENILELIYENESIESIVERIDSFYM